MAVRALTEVLLKCYVMYYTMDVLTMFSSLYKESRIFRKILKVASTELESGGGEMTYGYTADA